MNQNIQTLIKEISLDLSPCTPPFWAPTGHLQTILASFLPVPQAPDVTEVFHIKTENSEDLLHSSYIQGNRPVVVYLFHGLGGSIDSAYMKRFAGIAHSFGYHVFLNNHRGCGEGAGLAREGYHSGRSEDLSSIIAHGRKLFPKALHMAIGVSLSANALLLLSAGVRAKARPDLSIAINAPINLEKSAINLKSGLNRIYDRHFLKSLKNYLIKNNSEGLGNFHLLTDLHEFDDFFTAPAGGFKNREHYYSTCSAKDYLHLINIPTLIITAEDDPFVDYTDYLNAKFSETTVVHIEKTGGHIGYLQGHGLGYQFWIDEVIRKIMGPVGTLH